MRAAIYNPYLDTLGGGERYTIGFCEVLARKGYEVQIQWNNEAIGRKIEERFGVNLAGISFVKDIKRGDGYDICFWVSDGSIPLLRSRHNFLHFQVPFTKVNGRSLLNRMKSFRIEKFICNSYFTKKIIDEEYGIESIVVYPPCGNNKFKPKKKENIILYVGRFSELTQAKRQDVLVELFKDFYRVHKDWKLVLAGGVEVGSDIFLAKLKKSVKGYPVEIMESPSFEKLKDIYGKAKIYWSASGLGVDEEKEPQKVEHFGISVVEAMSAGCVPLVYNAGGFKEIIKEGENGYLWRKKSELVRKTVELTEKRNLFNEISDNAMKSSALFSFDRFEKEVRKLL